jgi:hypothetical protein
VHNGQTIVRIQPYQANCRLYGLTYGQWTVKWWRWSLSIPKSINPATDDSGKFAYVNQPTSGVWFLAGKVASEHRTIPKRFCKIPASCSILFPVVNCEISRLERPELKTDTDLKNHVDADEDTIILKKCIVDGKPVPVQRIKSDPEVFEVTISEDNIYGIKSTGRTTAAADGYWVFLRPLPIGEHYISFQGSCEKGKLNSGANYRLLIE